MKPFFTLIIILFSSCYTLSAQTTNVVSGLNTPAELLINGNDLYVAEAFDNKISKLNFNSLSTEDVSKTNNIKIYPNPALNTVQILGLEKAYSYGIYNTLGQHIKNGKISNQEKIKLETLNKGFYVLRVDHSTAIINVFQNATNTKDISVNI